MVFFMVGSCSIIKDDDIQSQEQLDETLRIFHIQFNEQIDPQLPEAQSVLGFISESSDGKITKIDWGGAIVPREINSNEGASSTMMRFNYLDVNSVPASITANISYGSNGYPSKITHVADDANFEFESWTYTYNSSNRIANMITKRTVPDGSYHIEINDELIYSGNKLSQVIRTIENLVAMTTVNHTINVTRNSSNVISKIFYEESPSKIRHYIQQCPNPDCYYYFSEFQVPMNTGPFGNPIVQHTSTSRGILQRIQLTDSRKNGQTGEVFFPERGPDAFVIHPLLILPDLFIDGKEISQVFINDWWVVNPISNENLFNITEDRNVFVKYKYTVDPI